MTNADMRRLIWGVACAMHGSEAAESVLEKFDLRWPPGRKKPAKKNGAVRFVPDEWAPSDAAWQFAVDRLGLDRSAKEIELFREHEFHKPKTDWDRAWRNWARRVGDYQAVNGSRARPDMELF